MTGLARRTAADWAGTYKGSTFCHEFVTSRAGRVVTAEHAGGGKGRRRLYGLGQLLTLARRNTLLKLRDRMQTVILLAQAPLFAILVSIVFRGLADKSFTDVKEWTEFYSKLSSAHFLMVVAAVWFGCNNAARDIVGETTIFQRERMVNLRLPSYVFSKMGVLALLCIVQCATLLGIVYVLCDLSGPFLTMLLVLVAASLAGTSIGLLISAVSPTTEAAIAFLPVVLLPFILLGGGIKPVNEMPEVAKWIAAVTPTRWAYEANLLQEAKTRNASFTSDVERQLRACQSGACRPGAPAAPARTAARGEAAPGPAAAALPEVETQRDIAMQAFPPAQRRSSLAFSFQVLGTFFVVFTILILSTLSLKVQR